MRINLLSISLGSLCVLTSLDVSHAGSFILKPTSVVATVNYGSGVIGRTLDYSGLSVVSGLETYSSVPALWPTDDTWGHVASDYLSANTQTVMITYDLGTLYTLGDGVNSLHVYNYNEGADAVNPNGWRGIQNVGIYYQGSGGSLTDPTSSYTHVLDTTFAAAPGLNSYRGDDYSYLNGVSAKYIRFEVTSNWDSTLNLGQGNFTGLSEIRFIIPEPSSSTLYWVGSTLVGYVWGRRKGWCRAK